MWTLCECGYERRVGTDGLLEVAQALECRQSGNGAVSRIGCVGQATGRKCATAHHFYRRTVSRLCNGLYGPKKPDPYPLSKKAFQGAQGRLGPILGLPPMNRQ